MSNASNHSLTFKSLEQAIEQKVRLRNKELKAEYYSYDIQQYEFVDINTYPGYRLLLFRCPKSNSTVSIKI